MDEKLNQIRLNLASKKLREMREKRILTDITLKCKGGTIYAHRCVLMATNSFFYNIFAENLTGDVGMQIEFEHWSVDVMVIVISTLYGDVPQTFQSIEQIMSVLETSHLIEEMMLFNYCMTLLIKLLTLDNCIDLWNITLKYGQKKAESIVKQFMVDHLGQLLKSNKLSDMSVDQMTDFVSFASKSVSVGDQLISVVMQWGKKNQVQRLDKVIALFNILEKLVFSSDRINCLTDDSFIKSSPELMAYLTSAKNRVTVDSILPPLSDDKETISTVELNSVDLKSAISCMNSESSKEIDDLTPPSPTPRALIGSVSSATGRINCITTPKVRGASTISSTGDGKRNSQTTRSSAIVTRAGKSKQKIANRAVRLINISAPSSTNCSPSTAPAVRLKPCFYCREGILRSNSITPVGSSKSSKRSVIPSDNPINDFPPIPSNRSVTANSRSPTPNSRSPTPNSRSPTSNSRSPTPNSRSPTPNSRSPTPNSRSPTPNSRSPTLSSRPPTPIGYQEGFGDRIKSIGPKTPNFRPRTPSVPSHIVPPMHRSKTAHERLGNRAHASNSAKASSERAGIRVSVSNRSKASNDRVPRNVVTTTTTTRSKTQGVPCSKPPKNRPNTTNKKTVTNSKISNLQAGPNKPNLQNVPNLPNSSNLPNLSIHPNTSSLQNLPNMPNLQNLSHLTHLPNLAHLSHLPSLAHLTHVSPQSADDLSPSEVSVNSVRKSTAVVNKGRYTPSMSSALPTSTSVSIRSGRASSSTISITSIHGSSSNTSVADPSFVVYFNPQESPFLHNDDDEIVEIVESEKSFRFEESKANDEDTDTKSKLISLSYISEVSCGSNNKKETYNMTPTTIVLSTINASQPARSHSTSTTTFLTPHPSVSGMTQQYLHNEENSETSFTHHLVATESISEDIDERSNLEIYFYAASCAKSVELSTQIYSTLRKEWSEVKELVLSESVASNWYPLNSIYGEQFFFAISSDNKFVSFSEITGLTYVGPSVKFQSRVAGVVDGPLMYVWNYESIARFDTESYLWHALSPNPHVFAGWSNLLATSGQLYFHATFPPAIYKYDFEKNEWELKKAFKETSNTKSIKCKCFQKMCKKKLYFIANERQLLTFDTESNVWSGKFLPEFESRVPLLMNCDQSFIIFGDKRNKSQFFLYYPESNKLEFFENNNIVFNESFVTCDVILN